MPTLRAMALACAALLAAGPCLAQNAEPPAAPGPASILAAAKADRAKELLVIEENLQKGAAARQAIGEEIATIAADKAALQTDLVATNARVREAEEKIAAARSRLETALTQEEALLRSLDSRRETIAEVLAALQRIGRRPPPAVVVQPDDILGAVRAAIQIGAVLPDMRAEAEQLARDVEALAAARSEKTASQSALENERRAVLADRDRLAALVAARQGEMAEQQRRLEQEEIRAKALSAQARSLKDLIGRLEQDDAATRRAEEASRLVPPPAAGFESQQNTRLVPNVAFASLRGALPLPAAGKVMKQFGASDGMGGTERGVTISTPASAIVTAPADGTVAFAGPFRSYGTVLILNGGDGFHLVFIGMQSANVRTGQFVLAGEPIGVMGRERGRVEGEDITASVASQEGEDAGSPVLYIELRKDGAPIDSRSWWAAEKAKDG
jgi:murein hydrolase activator